MIQVPILAGIVATVTYVLGQCVYRIFFHPLAGIPGPRAAKVGRLWQMVRYGRGTWHDDILNLHAEYGPVVRIAPNAVSFADAEHGLPLLYGHGTKSIKVCPMSGSKDERVWSRNSENKDSAPLILFEQSDWYHTWKISPKTPWGVFSMTDSQAHAQRRKQVARAYAMSSILSMEPKIQDIMNRGTQVLRERIDHAGRESAVIDMSTHTTAFTYDVIGSIGFGSHWNFLETHWCRTTTNIIDAVSTSFLVLANSGYIAGQTAWVRWKWSGVIWWLVGLDRSTFDQISWLASQAEAMIRQKREGNTTRRMDDNEQKDLLGLFMASKTVHGSPLAYEELLSEVLSLVAAGADTTSIGIRAALGPLLQNAQELRSVREEIDHVYTSVLEEDQEISYTQCLQLPHLQAVIKEGMRIHPSIVFQLPRLVPVGGVTINGHYLPEGMEASMSPLAMNRDPLVYGEDADLWKPSRWLEDTENVARMDRYLTTFGYGARSCMGKNIAVVEINIFVAQLLRHFELELVNPERPWKVHTCWAASQDEMYVQARRRNIQR